MLGANTKVLKAYGKRKTNTVNNLSSWEDDNPPSTSSRPTPLPLTKSTQPKQAGFNWSRLSDSDSDVSEEGEEEEVTSMAGARARPPPLKVQRAKALNDIRSKRATTTALKGGTRKLIGTSSMENKENQIDSNQNGKVKSTLKGRSKVGTNSTTTTRLNNSTPTLTPLRTSSHPQSLSRKPSSSSSSFTKPSLTLDLTIDSDNARHTSSSLKNSQTIILISDEDSSEGPIITRRTDNHHHHNNQLPTRSQPGGGKKTSKKVIIISDGSEYEDEEEDEVIVVTVGEPSTRSMRKRDESKLVGRYKEVEEDDEFPRRESRVASSRSKRGRGKKEEEEELLEKGMVQEEVVIKIGDLAEVEDNTEVEVEVDQLSSKRNSPSPSPSPSTDIYSLPSRPPLTSLRSHLPLPSLLTPLQSLSTSPHLLSFSSFVSSPPPPFLQSSTPTWTKVGEASYSEVFSAKGEGTGGELVVKVIPIERVGAGGRDGKEGEGRGREREPFKSDWEAVMREVEISKLVGSGQVEEFVEFKGMFLVQGPYPIELLSCWDKFKKSQKPPSDEQVRPDILPSNQIYALIILNHSGVDLENFKLKNWREGWSVFEQVLRGLKEGEERWEFEHRDLHWGNVLVRPNKTTSPSPSLSTRMNDLSLVVSTPPSVPPIKVTLIDFTLSRVKLPKDGRIIYDAFEDDCIFEGEGDEQFEVYRGMRDIVDREGGSWEKSWMGTNVLWLKYLIGKLLREKKLKVPRSPQQQQELQSSPRKPTSAHYHRSRPSLSSGPLSRRSRTLPSSSSSRSPKEEVRELQAEWEAYEKLLKMEEILVLALSGKEKKGVGKGKGKKNATSDLQPKTEFNSVGDVWEWYIHQLLGKTT